MENFMKYGLVPRNPNSTSGLNDGSSKKGLPEIVFLQAFCLILIVRHGDRTPGK